MQKKLSSDNSSIHIPGLIVPNSPILLFEPNMYNPCNKPFHDVKDRDGI